MGQTIMITPIHLAEVVNNKVKYFDYLRYDEVVRSLNGKKVEVIVSPRTKSQRSDRQNRYLFGVCYKLISEHTGFEVEEVHELMKFRFLRSQVGKYETTRSTKKLTTVEFNEYIEKINRFCIEEFGFDIPLPSKVDY